MAFPVLGMSAIQMACVGGLGYYWKEIGRLGGIILAIQR